MDTYAICWVYGLISHRLPCGIGAEEALAEVRAHGRAWIDGAEDALGWPLDAPVYHLTDRGRTILADGYWTVLRISADDVAAARLAYLADRHRARIMAALGTLFRGLEAQQAGEGEGPDDLDLMDDIRSRLGWTEDEGLIGVIYQDSQHVTVTMEGFAYRITAAHEF